MITQQNNQPVSDVDHLRQDATRAAAVRELTTHPDVVALRVEKVRSQVDVLMWAGIVLGLAFTMVNVQQFAAAGAAPWSLAWFAAWLLDPMVSVVLVAVLRAEQVTARWQVETGAWVRWTKLFAFAATLVMNTWVSWSHLHAAGVVLHSVPPLLVYCAAETGPVLRDKLSEAVLRAARTAADPPVESTGTPAANGTAGVAVNGPEAPSTNAVAGSAANGLAGVREQRPRTVARRATTTRRKAPAKTGRRLFADYLAEVRVHHVPGELVTPAWVRSVCPQASRGTSQKVADALNAEHPDADLDRVFDSAGSARVEGVAA